MTEEDIFIVKCIAWASMHGACPFGAAGIMGDGPTMAAIKRGLTGSDLKIRIDNERRWLIAEGIDPDILHRTDCDRPGKEDLE